jgi:SAM-dependent methyltransferase
MTTGPSLAVWSGPVMSLSSKTLTPSKDTVAACQCVEDQAMPDTMTRPAYAIAGGHTGRERLRLVSRVMADSTQRLLDSVGVRHGSIWLDVGCGGGDVTVELARRVGARGRVVGVDLDSAKLEIARDEARREGLDHIEYMRGDACKGLPAWRFDGIYARFLLSHLAAPEAALAAFASRLAPGGVLAVEDIDASGHVAWPPDPAVHRYRKWLDLAMRRSGGDPDIGPRLPGLLQQAGFEQIQVHVVQPLALQGDTKRLAAATTAAMADTICAYGLASAHEVSETVAALGAFAADPSTLIGTPRVFQVWGRRRTNHAEERR